MKDWKKYFEDFKASTYLKDESVSIRVCRLATRAEELGTYGAFYNVV